jgi:DNA-binding transcriptional MerR regulator
MHGAYKIGTVARLIGIDAMTRRNWERRYGVVIPSRGNGRQRAYAPEDVDRLRWLKRTVDSGLSAGEAHALLRQRLDAGRLDESAPRVREQARQFRNAAVEARRRAKEVREQIGPLEPDLKRPRTSGRTEPARSSLRHALKERKYFPC